MCGFLGEFSFNNELTLDNEFKELLKLSKHRGPDSTGVLKEDYYQLGFNRLAILDLSSNGNQPKTSVSNRYHIVFNGEIYNFKELEKKYNLKNLNSTSDSEVLIHLIDKIGIYKTVKLLDGMFAFMLIDTHTEKSYLVRDFSGIKPLFYGINNLGVVAASQFDQIFKHSWFKDNLKLNVPVVKEYFGVGFMNAPNTIYNDLYQVLPGEVVEISKLGKITKNRYCVFSEIPDESCYYEDDSNTLNAFIERINKTIKEQLVSDVSIGTFLSGGIDSPLVTSFAKKNKKDVSAFTIAVNDKKIDESLKASEYAHAINVNHKIETINESDVFKIVDKHFKYISEPFGDYSSIPSFLITAKCVKEHKVMLSGDGADELFFGYPKLLDLLIHAHYFKIPFFIRKIYLKILRSLGKVITYGPSKYRKLSSWALGKQLYIQEKDLDEFIPNYSFSSEFVKNFSNLDSYSDTNDLFKKLKINDFNTHLQRVLIKVDRTSMANSLEVRVPFLSKNIVNYGMSLINKKYNKNYVLKGLLKRALSKFIPKNLLSKDKKGFSVPIEDWLKNELKEDVEKFIFDKPFYGTNILQEENVKNYVRLFLEENKGSGWGVWHIYSWQKWAYNNGLIR